MAPGLVVVAQLRKPASQFAGQVYHEAQLAGLPTPVQRYFRRVRRDGQLYLRGLRLRHTGQFKTDLKKSWIAIEGEQYITADPPGFIGEGTTRQFVASDEFVAGRGRLTVRLLGAVPIAGGTGPAYDQGELLRWPVESTWLPTNLLPDERVGWTAIDDHSAQQIFTYACQSISCQVRFNERDEMESSVTRHYFNKAVQLPWVVQLGRYRQWQDVLVLTDRSC